MNSMRRFATWAVVISTCALAVVTGARGSDSDEPLRVFATVPDLAALAKRVGGVHVDVFAMVDGREDAHFAEARPSFVKRLADADVYLEVGLELEAAYAPVLLQNARNGALTVGSPGRITAADAVSDRIGPSGPITRARGDVHASGDPHFLVDPIAGIEVAGLIRDRLSTIAPANAEAFAANYRELEREIRSRLAGWLAQLEPYRGAKVVDDHAMWSYFARRFRLDIVGHLEPFAGVPPTTKHLTEIVEQMRADNVEVIIASPYYDTRHAEKIAAASGAVVARLTHQVGGMPGTGDYVAMVDYNVRTTAEAFARARTGVSP